MEKQNPEILIIGCGAAGLRAAIEARESGLEVLVVSKHPAGKGTSTLLSGGAFSGFPKDFTREVHRARTTAAGRGLNQADLLDAFITDAPNRLQELVDWGLPSETYQGTLVTDGNAPALGQGILTCLYERAKGLGVTFLSGQVVWRIIPRASGFLVPTWSVPQGCWLPITARSVILATGGPSGLYKRHDNPRRMMGDGYILALDAGATLQDLEFVQFFPLAMAEKKRPMFLIPPSLELLGPMTNQKGEDIHAKYNLKERPAALKARDHLSQALFQEIEIDRGEVTLDLRGVSKDDWCVHPFAAQLWDLLAIRCEALEKPLRIAPAAHFFMGGVSITPDCTTTVPGLFACGEVAGSLHGANRMGGNALTETIVFGARAGHSAAEWVKDQSSGIAVSIEDLDGFLPSGGGRDQKPSPLKNRLKEIMWSLVGIVRSEEGLREAAEKVEELAVEVRKLNLPGDPLDMAEYLELVFAVRLAPLIIRSALRRQESRGAHFRLDFPQTDDTHWLKRTLVSLDPDGGEKWAFKPA